jgi:hypothetical protein
VANHPTPKRLELPLQGGEILKLPHLTVADGDFGPARKQGLDQAANVVRRILVVRIRIDDDVRPLPEAFFQSGCECRRQSKILGKADYMVRARGSRHLDRVVLAAIVNDEDLNPIDAWNLPRQRRQRFGKRRRFVITRYLND